MLSAVQLFRLISIPAGIAMFIVAAQISAGLNERIVEPMQLASGR